MSPVYCEFDRRNNMNFSEAAKNESKKTFTENGATAFNTTDNALVDLFSTIGSLRNTSDDRVTRLFSEAYKIDPLMATKILYYARDIREGLGERKTFRTIIRYMATYMPEALRPNLDLIGVYGRYDDLYSLIGTPLENDMWTTMKSQFEEDCLNLTNGDAISLLAKWIKTADASSKNTRKLGILTAKKLGYSVYDFKRIVRTLRKQIGVIESLMSQGRWNEIKYPEVPSRAMMIYRNAFMKHDEDRYKKFVADAVQGKAKINSSTLYPYDLVGKVRGGDRSGTVEAQWRQLPNYVQEGSHAIVMADTSGSMNGMPMNSALGLAIYFAERNVGPYKDLFMTFSSKPKFHTIKGNTLLEKLRSIDMSDWEMNTNLHAAFDLILKTAINNHVPAEDMPKVLIVVSDMEIDYCAGRSWGFYDTVKEEFEEAGYKIPTVIFWNVNSRHDVFHADANRKGVQLYSGQSTTIFKKLMENIDFNAYEAMMKTINSDRYDAITIER